MNLHLPLAHNHHHHHHHGSRPPRYLHLISRPHSRHSFSQQPFDPSTYLPIQGTQCRYLGPTLSHHSSIYPHAVIITTHARPQLSSTQTSPTTSHHTTLPDIQAHQPPTRPAGKDSPYNSTALTRHGPHQSLAVSRLLHVIRPQQLH